MDDNNQNHLHRHININDCHNYGSLTILNTITNINDLPCETNPSRNQPSPENQKSRELSSLLLIATKNNSYDNDNIHLLGPSSSSSTSHINPNDYGNDPSNEFRPSISRALEYCQNEVLPPYKRLLIFLGWQPVNFPNCPNCVCLKSLVNSLHVIFLLMAICSGHILQYASCFRQSSVQSSSSIIDLNTILIQENKLHPKVMQIQTTENGTQVVHYFNLSRLLHNLVTQLKEDQELDDASGQLFLHCHGSMFSHYLVPGLIHLISFLIILRHLRFCEVDRFHNLCLSNQLLATKIIGHQKASIQIKNSVSYWIMIVFVCLSLIMVQIAFRMFIINDVSFKFIPKSYANPTLLLFLKTSCFVLFAFIELVHISIIIIYALHCQMNIIFIQMNLTAIREKRIDFQEFAKNTEIFKMNINFLNNRYSLSVSLLMIYLTTKALATLLDLFTKYRLIHLDVIILAITMLIYWSILLMIPLYQAARLTQSCQSIGDIGHELCARPFCYQKTARDDLDSLLTYTSSLNLKARLLMISVRPSCIISIILVVVFILLILSQLQLIDI